LTERIRPGRTQSMKARWFVRGDIDGFFGLFIDNMLQLMLISILCQNVCGMPAELVNGKILPGAALSILFGNAFYSWQARRLAEKTGRPDVTALPYGINTVSLFAFVFLIMAPVYFETKNPTLAWQVGLFACFLSAVMEIAAAFVGDVLRRYTPRAALLSALAGIAITFISMGFVFQIFASPSIALIPMMLILIPYASGVKLPIGLPGGLVAVLTGIALAWILQAWGVFHFPPAPPSSLGVYPPSFVPSDVFALIADPRGWKYLSVVFPMGLFNVIGSLQNLESAEAAGDRYSTRSSLLANGLGGLTAALFGSAFPTTIYIGHPGWKAMGARIGYSVINGVVITILCLIGGVTLILRWVPLEATLGILLWIGIIITAQAFQETPKKHALAVALGLIPSLASWALLLIETTARKAGTSLMELAPKFGSDLYIYGVFSLSQGFLLSSMLLAAILVFIIEREFLKAAFWTLAASILSATGVIHAYKLGPAGLENHFGFFVAKEFALGYLATGFILIFFHLIRHSSKNLEPETEKLG
jgi:adenine/guanine/hypoxanthine permease